MGVERIELITDSAGSARFRGDVGVRADYRILTDGVSATAVLTVTWSPRADARAVAPAPGTTQS